MRDSVYIKPVVNTMFKNESRIHPILLKVEKISRRHWMWFVKTVQIHVFDDVAQ